MLHLHDYQNVPEHIRDGLENYLVHGIEPGGFLMAVLTNNLYGSVFSADSININRIPHIVSFLHTVPSICIGNIENVRMWMNDTDGIRSNYVKKLREGKICEALEKQYE